MVCPCVSLKTSVVVIGVLTGVLATIFLIVNIAAYTTLEGQLQVCRQDTRVSLIRHSIKLLESCEILLDATYVFSSRVFMFVQIGMLFLMLVFSVTLGIGASKGRTGLMIPWMVFLVIIMASILYDAISTGLNDIMSLLFSVAALLTSAFFLMVVWMYIRQLSKRTVPPSKGSSAMSASSDTTVYDIHRHTPPTRVSAAPPGVRYLRYSDLIHDLPPDYETAAADSASSTTSTGNLTTNTTSQTLHAPRPTQSSIQEESSKLPANLGVLR